MNWKVQIYTSLHPRFPKRLPSILQVLLACLVVSNIYSAVALAEERDAPRFLRQHPSVKNSEWVRADFFLKASFSGQKNNLSEIVSSAASHGFDVIAVVDDHHQKDASQTETYATEIMNARLAHPEMVILSGLHWKISPTESEHDLTILMPASPKEFEILREFKKQFCNSSDPLDPGAIVKQSLQWLKEQSSPASKPVVLANSTSWLGESSSATIKSLEALRRDNDLVVGFPISAPLENGGRFETASQGVRTERVREEAWDQLLIRGNDVHVAFSHSKTQHLNAEQSKEVLTETWVSVEEATAEGVLTALRHGSFFTSRGGIVRDLRFSVAVVGLQREVAAGEEIIVAAGTPVRVILKCDVPGLDSAGNSNWLDNIEFTSISYNGIEKPSKESFQIGTASFEWSTTVPEGGMVLRGSGYRAVEDGNQLNFYTNSIRIRTETTRNVWSASDVLSSTFFFPLLKYLAVAFIGIVVFWFSLRRFSRRRHRRRSFAPNLASRPLSVQQPEALGATQVPGTDWQPPGEGDLKGPPSAEGAAPQGDASLHSPNAARYSAKKQAKAPLLEQPLVNPVELEAFPFPKHFRGAFYFYFCFVVYASLIPLNFKPIQFDAAFEKFAEILSFQLNLTQRSDFVANTLLFIPLSFFAAGSISVDKGRIRPLWYAPFLIVTFAVMSVLIELLQVWFPPRTVSQNDVVTETIGAAIGIFTWIIIGQKLTDLIRRFTSPPNQQERPISEAPLNHRSGPLITKIIVALALTGIIGGVAMVNSKKSRREIISAVDIIPKDGALKLNFPEDPYDRDLINVSSLQLIGGWRVPAATQPEWKSLAFTNGGLATRIENGEIKFYLTHHNHLGGPIQELVAQKRHGSPELPPKTWPLLEVGHFLGNLYQPASDANAERIRPVCTGVYWDKKQQRLMTTGRAGYAAPPPKGPFLCMADVSNPASPVVTGPFGTSVGSAQSLGGGVCRIPDWFADQFLAGKTLGIGFGGYCSGEGSTHGPSLVACSDDLQLRTPAIPLLMFGVLGSNAVKREHRPPDYEATLGWAVPPNGEIGYWASDRVTAGPVWIETPTRHGLCYWTIQGCGPLKYSRQTATFGETTQERLYVYDPAMLEKVAKNEIKPFQSRGKFADCQSPISGLVVGACWDQDTQTLFLLHRSVWKSGLEILPVIAAYKIGE